MSCGSAGRLYSSSSSWTPSADDFTSPWVQIFFGSLYIITDVVTQGHHEENRWVTSYTLSSSLDSGQWLEYKDAYTSSGPTVFPGNYKISSLVEQSLYPPLMTRYIRIHPRTYNLSISLRFDLRGFGPLADYIGDIYEPNMKCNPLLGGRLGVANSSIIPDSYFSASNPSNAEILKPSNGRLFGEHVWASKSYVDVGWWQVDLGVLYHVTGVITQGRELESVNQWVTSYVLSISPDETTWMNAGEGNCGIWKVFPANYDKRSLVTNLVPKPLPGRFVKLYPLSWSVWPSIRCEILGFL